MNKSRLESFSDGVLAVIITVMVLDLKRPAAAIVPAFVAVLPSVATYLVSFVYIGIYWSNHHHMLQSSERVTGRVLWANLVLLFWLSLVPAATAWLGSLGFEPLPVATYAGLQFMAAVAYHLLSLALVATHGQDSMLARALGRNIKGKVSLAAYAVAIGLAWIAPSVSCGILVAVAIFWLVPDKRFESAQP